MLSIGQKIGMKERKNSVDGQSSVARGSDSAMNAGGTGGIQKSKLPIIAWMELSSVGELPWAQRAAVHLVVYAVVKQLACPRDRTPGVSGQRFLSEEDADNLSLSANLSFRS
jgi:hypothetical protein